MTDTELLAELVERKALIVHCSRVGKADEGIGGLFFPEDLRNAINICANRRKELCCSVIWPEHIKTFGAVGIIVKPRSTKSITSICTIDGGTSVDPTTCRRVGRGMPFSKQRVMDTFTKATDYNEWNVQDADTIGIFVNSNEPLEVAMIVPMDTISGYDPSMGAGQMIRPVPITWAEVALQFPGLPIYTFRGTEIIRVEDSKSHPVNASDIYL
jgi:hypothetical protein